MDTRIGHGRRLLGRHSSRLVPGHQPGQDGGARRRPGKRRHVPAQTALARTTWRFGDDFVQYGADLAGA